MTYNNKDFVASVGVRWESGRACNALQVKKNQKNCWVWEVSLSLGKMFLRIIPQESLDSHTTKTLKPGTTSCCLKGEWQWFYKKSLHNFLFVTVRHNFLWTRNNTSFVVKTKADTYFNSLFSPKLEDCFGLYLRTFLVSDTPSSSENANRWLPLI